MDIKIPEPGTGRLFIVSGPSGSGKSTLCREAVKLSGAHLSVSATTRSAGEKEIEGKDYYFLTDLQFKDMIQAGEFLEYAEVFGFYYGTPAQPVIEKLKQGHTVVLEIDVQGAEQVFKRFPQAIGVLVLPPDSRELKRRLCNRGRDDDQTIERRLKKAQWEIEQAKNSGNYQHTVINDVLDQAVKTFVDLIAE